MKLINLLLFVVVLSLESLASNDFTVVAPHSIRRGKPFNVVVKGFSLSDTLNADLEISGISDTGIEVKKKKSAVISESRPKALIQFITFNFTQGSYNLTVTSGDYSEVKPLHYSTNNYAFLVQTDKSLYFSNDLLRFRVFAINSETRAINPRHPATVVIRDGSGSVVSNVTDVQFIKGRYQAEWQLPSNPTLGFWKIEVRCGDDIGEKEIEVAESTIPLIYAGLSIPSKVPISNAILPVVINAKYSFNDVVVGIATVIFERFGTEYYRVDIDIVENTGNFDVDLLYDLRAAESEVFSYDVHLEYYDQLTNTTVTDFTTFETLPQAYSIVLTGDPYLVPGSDFNYCVVVVKYDGTPASAGITVNVNVEALGVSQALELDDNGFAFNSFNVPLETSSFVIKAIAEDATEAILNAGLALPLPGTVNNTRRSTMRVDVISKEPAIQSTVEVQITLNETIEAVTCIIVAKNVLLETIEVPITIDDTKIFQTAKFTFKPTFAYAPISSIIAYFVRHDGRIVTASTSVELMRDLRNYLTVTPTNSERKPGETIELDVESYVNSTVSLFAVDQRIESLRSGNNLAKSEIFKNILHFYSSASNQGTSKPPDYEFRFNYYGLLVFTNIVPHPASLSYKRRSLLNQLNRSSKLNQTATTALSGPPRSINIPKPFAKSILWQNVDIKGKIQSDLSGERGRERISEIASQDLASYIVYGVSMSRYKGIGLLESNTLVDILLPFTISTDFPYSIKVSEVLVQGITINNFVTEDQEVEIIINKDPKYEIDLTSSPDWIDSGETYIRTLTAYANVNLRVQFVIRATAVGTINFRIQARGSLAGDAVDRVLRITPIGVYRTSTDSRILNIGQYQNSGSLSCSIPSSVLEFISTNFTYTGDIMSRPITNAPTGLIVIPSGCGEQNLLKVVIDIIIWIYLKGTNQLTPTLLLDLTKNVNLGISLQSNFSKTDGSYATYSYKPRGSTWLTAYAGLGFYLAKDLVTVDMTRLKKGLGYLQSQQQSNGLFYEASPLMYYTFQSAGATITLTAYITIYVTTALSDFPEYSNMQQKAVAYLEDNWHSRTDVYGLAIIAYALKLAGSPKADNVMNFFFMTRTETAREIYYDSVETTAYCLLLLLVRNERLNDAAKIANYLIRISNARGGYYSSQDTVMAIYALSKYALVPEPATTAQLTITPNVGDPVHVDYNSSLALTLQTVKLNKTAHSVNVDVSGARSGNLIISLTCAYYEQSVSFQPAFRITYKYTYTCRSQIIIKLLLNFIPVGQSTGMSIATVTFPSGFAYNRLYNGPDVTLTEPAKNGQVVTFYFDKMTNNETSIQFGAIRSNFVEGARLEGYIEVLDYYNPVNEASATYVLPSLSNSCGVVSRK